MLFHHTFERIWTRLANADYRTASLQQRIERLEELKVNEETAIMLRIIAELRSTRENLARAISQFSDNPVARGTADAKSIAPKAD